MFSQHLACLDEAILHGNALRYVRLSANSGWTTPDLGKSLATDHISTTLQTTYRPRYRPHIDYIQITFRSRYDQISTTYRPRYRPLTDRVTERVKSVVRGLSLARTHPRTNFYDMAFSWICLNMYIIKGSKRRNNELTVRRDSTWRAVNTCGVTYAYPMRLSQSARVTQTVSQLQKGKTKEVSQQQLACMWTGE